jgi:sugar phosphate isomerase/epimerase
MEIGVCAKMQDAALVKAAGGDFIEGVIVRDLKPMDEHWAPAVAREDLALPLVGLNSLFPASLKITGPDADIEAIKDYAMRTCSRAQEMGSEFIVFGSGGARSIPDGWPRDKGEAQFVEALRELAPIAAAAGQTVVLEPLNRGESNILNTMTDGLDLMRRAAVPNITVLCDFFHFALDNEPMENLDACRGLITHAHLAEPVGRVAPHPGGTDLKPWFRKLKEIGYGRRLSIECSWTDMAAQLAPTIEFLRKEWDAA